MIKSSDDAAFLKRIGAVKTKMKNATAKERLAIILKWTEQMTTAEIAATLRITEDETKKILARLEAIVNEEKERERNEK